MNNNADLFLSHVRSLAREIRIRAVGTIAAVGSALLACSPATNPDPERNLPLAPEVEGYVDARDWLSASPDLSLQSLATASPAEPHTEGLKSFAVTPTGGLRFGSLGEIPGFAQWQFELDADRIYDVELVVDAEGPVTVRLLWKSDDSPEFEFQNGVQFRFPKEGVQRARRVLRGRQGWKGMLRGLRIQIEGELPTVVEVTALSGRGWFDLGARANRKEPLEYIRYGNETRPARVLSSAGSVHPVSPGTWKLSGALANPMGLEGTLTASLVDATGDRVESWDIPIGIDKARPGGILWQPFEVPVGTVSEGASIEYDYQLPDARKSGGFLLAVGRELPLRRLEGSPLVGIVSLDTLRRDAVGVLGGPPGITPNLDRLSEASIIFEQAYAPSPWTLPSHVSLFSGLAPARHGVEGGGRVFPGAVWTLPGALRNTGYETVAVTEGGFVDSRFGFAKGFDRYVELPSHHLFQTAIDLILREIESATGPLFIFLHTYQAHSPYDPDPEFFRELRPDSQVMNGSSSRELIEEVRGNSRELSPRERDDLKAAYLAGVHRTDALFGDFMNGFDEAHPEAPSFLVVTSDHGESFQERDSLVEHGERLYPELLAVPLLVRISGHEGNTVRRDLVSLMDIAPSLAALLELPVPNSVDGRPLFQEGSSPVSGRSGIPASVQEAATQTYHVGRVTENRVDTVSLGLGEAKVLSYEMAPPVGSHPSDLSANDLYEDRASFLGGRWEIALDLRDPESRLALDLKTSGRFADAILIPTTVGKLVRREGSLLSFEGNGVHELRRITLLVEVVPADASITVGVPPSLRDLAVSCGNGEARSLVAQAPGRCFEEAFRGPSTPKPVQSVQSIPTLWARKHAGPGLVGEGTGTKAPRIDAELEAQLAALGYAHVEATLDEQKGEGPATGSLQIAGPRQFRVVAESRP